MVAEDGVNLANVAVGVGLQPQLVQVPVDVADDTQVRHGRRL